MTDVASFHADILREDGKSCKVFAQRRPDGAFHLSPEHSFTLEGFEIDGAMLTNVANLVASNWGRTRIGGHGQIN